MNWNLLLFIPLPLLITAIILLWSLLLGYMASKITGRLLWGWIVGGVVVGVGLLGWLIPG